MHKLGIFISVLGTFLLVILALGMLSYRAPDQRAYPVTMEESGRTMYQAGISMRNHGQLMVAQGQLVDIVDNPDLTLVSWGTRWLSDGQLMAQRGQFMGADPLASTSLHSTQAELKDQGNWNTLVGDTKAMIHNPNQTGSLNLQALRWDGQGMVSEGETMAGKGLIMAEEIEQMVKQGHLDPVGPETDELRQSAQLLHNTGLQLARNGGDMLDYADRLDGSGA